jgi:hypothetical protein
VVQHYAEPRLCTELANPHMEKLEFFWDLPANRIPATVPLWTKDTLQQFGDKWEGKANRLKSLAFLPWQPTDAIFLLIIRLFPELEQAPCRYSLKPVLSGDTVREAYATWAFCDSMPPDWAQVTEGTSTPFFTFRTPLTELSAENKLSFDEFFRGWSEEDFFKLLSETTQLRILKLQERPRLEEKLRTTIVCRNPLLRSVVLSPRGPLSDQFYLQCWKSCPDLITLNLFRGESDVESKISAETLLKLVRRVPYITLTYTTMVSLTSKDLVQLGVNVYKHRHSLELVVLTAELQKMPDEPHFKHVVGRVEHGAPLRLRVPLEKPDLWPANPGRVATVRFDSYRILSSAQSFLPGQ